MKTFNETNLLPFNVSHYASWQEVMEGFLCFILFLLQLTNLLNDFSGKHPDNCEGVLDEEVEDEGDKADEGEDGNANSLPCLSLC